MAPPAVEVRCAGCGETLEVDHGTTEFACPGCATAQHLPPELMPPPPRPRRAIPLSPAGAAQDRVPCGGCGAVLSVPPGFKSFGCPVCAAAARRPQASSRPDSLPAAHPVPPGQEVLEDPLSPATHSGLVHVERYKMPIRSEQSQGWRPNHLVYRDESLSSFRADKRVPIHGGRAHEKSYNPLVHAENSHIEPLDEITTRPSKNKSRIRSSRVDKVHVDCPSQAIPVDNANQSQGRSPSDTIGRHGKQKTAVAPRIIGKELIEPPNQAAHEQQAHGTSSDRVVHADQVQVEPGSKTAAWNQKRKRSGQSAAGNATMSMFRTMFQQDIYQIIYIKKKFAKHRFVKWSYLGHNLAYNGLYRLFRNVSLDSLVSLRCNFHAKTIRQFYATVYVSPDHDHLIWMTGQQRLEASKDDFLSALSLGDSRGIKVHLQEPLALTQVDEFYDQGNHFIRGRVSGLLSLPSIINRIMRVSFFPRSGNNDEIHGHAWNVVKYIMDGTRIDVMDLMIREIATSKGDKAKSIYFAPYIMKLIKSKIDFDNPYNMEHKVYIPRDAIPQVPRPPPPQRIVFDDTEYNMEHKVYRPRDAPPQVPPPPPHQPQGQGSPPQEHPGQQAPQEQDPIMAVLSRLQSSVDRMNTRFDQIHAVQIETRAMVEGLNVRFDGMDSKVAHLDERLTEYQQQRVPLAYQRFGRGQRPPSFTQRGDHPSSSEAPPSS